MVKKAMHCILDPHSPSRQAGWGLDFVSALLAHGLIHHPGEPDGVLKSVKLFLFRCTSRSSNLILCKLGVDDREGSLRLSPRLSLFYSLNSTQTDED